MKVRDRRAEQADRQTYIEDIQTNRQTDRLSELGQNNNNCSEHEQKIQFNCGTL